MTLRQVEVFLAVLRAQSFSRAAETLSLSQPTLSQHVRELEGELGTRLFDRRGRRIAPTEAGRIFEEHAARLLAALGDARQAVVDLGGLTRGSLLVGASTTPGIYVLPGVIAAFRSRYPGIALRLRIANSRIIEQEIRANEADLGVVGGHLLDPEEPCLAAGLVDELVLVVPPPHPWAHRRQIEPHRLADEPLLMREQGSATRRVTERTLQQAKIAFRPAMELDHIEAIKQAVMAGLGVAFVSMHAVRGEVVTGRLVAVRVRGLRMRRHFHVIHDEKRVLGASARAFLDVLQTWPRSKASHARRRS